jgi:hypothetical protein
VPYHWVVDPVARVLQELRLDGASYAAGAVLEDTASTALPPLTGPTLDPAAVWR